MSFNVTTGSADVKFGRLLPRHLADLRSSGLSDEQIGRCGFYSEADPGRVADLLNWKRPANQLGPCLCIPFVELDGGPVRYVRVKPDTPLTDRKGKPRKYESPKARPNRAYLPPFTKTVLLDPTVPLLITEGEKKSAKADQEGSACIGLVGVWGWQRKQTAGPGGKKIGPRELIPDLAAVAWAGRRVYLLFDSDAADKPNVKAAERQLAEALRRAGADVRVIRLPPAPDGLKNGLDDYLVRHGTDALRQLIAAAGADTTPSPPVDAKQFTESGYTAINGTTYQCHLTRDPATGELRIEKQTKLANFAARIVGETVRDDGAEQTRELAVAVEQRGGHVRAATVPVERFSSLDWVVEQLGPRYVIQPGSGKRDNLRCAIQEMSGDNIASITLYCHTGWREVGGRWCYLHGGGAVVPDVPRVPVPPRVEVRLDGAAAGYALPEPSAGDKLRAAIRSSLGILDGLVPDSVGFPLLATSYRAALGAADYALWLVGPTGAQKSELAALVQQHYGARMNRGRLPGSWSSTDNALEGLAFTVKDALFVIDDFAPPPARADADRQHRTAERLIRGQGNHAGRQRMRADGTLRPPKPPRGLILATGEDVPRGHSITARLCVVEVQKGQVNLHRLSECQRNAAGGRYAAALAGFCAWLAPQYADVLARLDAERIDLRDQFIGRYAHARTPDLIANLLLGLRYLLRFAESAGAIDRAERDSLWDRGLVAFRDVAGQQGEHHRAVDPVARFPEMLAAVVSSGRGHVAGTDGREPGIPPSPETWGWEGREYRSGTDETSVSYSGRGRKIGWVEGEELYLDPDSTFAALSELARDQGQTYPVTQPTLYRRLKEAKVLLRYDGNHTTYPVSVEGARRRVLVFRTSLLCGNRGQLGHPGQPPANGGETVPVSCPGSQPGEPKVGHETGTIPPGKSARVPVVPLVPVSGDQEGEDVEVFAP